MESDWSEWSEEEIRSLMTEDYSKPNIQIPEKQTPVGALANNTKLSEDNNYCNESTSGPQIMENVDEKSENDDSGRDKSEHSIWSEQLNPIETTPEANKNVFYGKPTNTCGLHTFNDKQKEHVSSDFSSSKRKRKGRYRKHKEKNELKYISSSDEDIPLCYYAKGARVSSFDDTDSDLSYDPKKENDYNSTDCEFQDIADNKTKRKLQKDKHLKKIWEDTVKFAKDKQKSSKLSSPFQRLKEDELPKSGSKEHLSSIEATEEIMEKVVEESAQLAEMQRQAIQTETAKIDKILEAHNLVRENVAPYGNCFFESCAKQLNTNAASLRSDLCLILEENIEDYITFAVSNQQQENKDLVEEYFSEIKKLKQDG